MSAPLVRIAHRGGGSLAPENSLEGLELALSYGVEMVEVDIRRTSDGALVLSHDDVAPATGLSCAASTLSELRAGRAEDAATLDEALDAAKGRARLNLDIKDLGCVDALVERVRAHDAFDRVIVSCLDAPCLARVHAAEPRIERFFSYPNDYGGASRKKWLTPAVNAAVAAMRATLPRRLPAMMRPCPGAHATIYYKLVTSRLVRMAHRRGLQLYTWTVDDPAEMRRLVALGIDGITSNRPDLLAGLGAGAPDEVRV